MTGYGKMEIMGKQAGQVTGQGTIHDLKSLSKRHWVGLSINYIWFKAFKAHSGFFLPSSNIESASHLANKGKLLSNQRMC